MSRPATTDIAFLRASNVAHAIVKMTVLLAEEPATKPKFPLVSSKEALEAIAVNGRGAFIVGVVTTTRNWSTVTKIVASAIPSQGSKVAGAHRS